MIDANAINISLKKELGDARIDEQWNGTLVSVSCSGDKFPTIKSKLLSIFSETKYEFDDDGGYDEPSCTILAYGPNTSSGKNHRWQVNVLSLKDEEAMDDMGSYLAHDLVSAAQPGEGFVVVVFDNDAHFEE